jgi:anti-sigma B factor antagonist
MSEPNKFRVARKSINDIELMYLHGFLDAHTAPELENAIQQSIVDSKFNLLVNFEHLEYISSAGLGVFMSFIEEIRDKGGDIKMAAMNDKVFSVFDLLGFPMLFDIHKEEEYIINKFSDSEIE